MKRNATDQVIYDLERYYDWEDVAKASNVHVSTLRRWVRRESSPSWGRLLRVAEVLGYHVTANIRRH